jgi:hypothetical protein
MEIAAGTAVHPVVADDHAVIMIDAMMLELEVTLNCQAHLR